MRIMWLTAMVLPIVAEALNKKSIAGSGGWVISMLDHLCESSEVGSIDVVTVSNIKKIRIINSGKIRYVVLPSSDGTFKKDNVLYKHINTEINDFKPDIIDNHGVEFFLCKSLLETKTTVPIVSTLQGLTCQIYKYYYSGISSVELVRNRTIRDNLMFDGIIERKFRYKRRGYNEIDVLQRLKYVIGRTEWDRAVSASINPIINYFSCNRILRDEFYGGKWDIANVKRHTLFMTQAHYPIKGLHILLEALSVLVFNYPDICLYISGKDMLKRQSVFEKLAYSGYQRYIERLIKKHKLENNVVFTGRLCAEKIVDKLQSTHVFILPSVIENSPNALAEAQMIGVPSIAAMVGGVPDYIKDGVTGLLYSCNEPIMLANKIREIFDNDDLATMLSSNEKKVAIERHDKVKNSEQLINVYKSIVELEN